MARLQSNPIFAADYSKNNRKTDYPMKGFLTIREAVNLTGTSESTMRRWLRQLNSHDQAHVKRDGQRIVIEQSFLEKSFDIQTAELVEHDGRASQGQGGEAIRALAGTVERLLEDNARKDAELKDAWLMIIQLKDQVKALAEGRSQDGSGAPDRLQSFVYIALLVIAAALLVWLVAFT